MPADDNRPEMAKLVAAPTFTPKGLFPRQIVSAYDPAQWEEFIQEWTQGLRTQYKQVQKFSGPGDKGRDVVGFLTEPVSSSVWDNYQCKRYGQPLRPNDILVELGKLCYYTFNGDYTVPRKYRFVAPHDVGPKLRNLLLKPDELRQELINQWPSQCEESITDTQKIPLEGALLAHVKAFDFTIVGYSPLVEVIEQHMKSGFWATRFGQAPATRPAFPAVPLELAPHEARYVDQLLKAYSEAEGRQIRDLAELEAIPKYHEHLKRSRQCFFQAESLDRFSRDNYPPGEFEKVKRQVFDGVIDTVEKDHAHGFERVCATTECAAGLVLGNTELASYAEVGDRKGVCHHLANEDKVKWVKE